MDFTRLAVLRGLPDHDSSSAVGLPIYATAVYGFADLEDGAHAQCLQSQPQVAWVRYPGPPTDPAHPRASQYLCGGFVCILTFGIRGGIVGASRFLAYLNKRQAPNVGDVRTLAVHPWATTHARIAKPARLAAGVRPEMIRFPVGLESLGDIQKILVEGLAAVE